MGVIKKNLSFIITILLAAMAAIVIYLAISAMMPTVPVVVASQNMKVGTVIAEEQLTVKKYPKADIPGTSFASINDVAGKTVINGPVVAGDMIRQEHLSLSGSLMAVLKTFAPKAWTAVELPAGGGAGMKGLKKGDKVNIYGEVGSEGGLIVAELVKPYAIILAVPEAEKSNQQFVVAVPAEYAPGIAETVVRQKPIAISLPSEIRQTALPPTNTVEEGAK